MNDYVTHQERMIFREAFIFYTSYCNPPSNQSDDAVEWWAEAAREVGALDAKWQEYPLMRSLLFAIYDYIGTKTDEKTASGCVTHEDRLIFREAFTFFSKYCDPPANQYENAVEWWSDAAQDVGTLDAKWQEYPLMRNLLIAIYEHMEFKAKERTREVAEFVQEL